jgi:multidrug efflux system outer membrane protein
MELRGAQQRRRIAEHNIELQQQTLDITRRKLVIGLVPELDALRAQGQLEATQALLPQIRLAERAAAYRLAVLTGRPPEALLETLTVARPLPAVPASLAVGTRADLLKRRPDVRAAERALAAAVADVGAAQADFFPRLTLGATGGFESADLPDLLSGDSRKLGVLPQLTVPVFQGGRLRAAHDAASARAEAALADYRQAVLGALQDAETALAAVDAEREVGARLAAASAANAEAAQIATRLYARGLTGFLDLLNAEARLAASEDAHSQSETRLRLALVRLYRSLGGGWPALDDGAPTGVAWSPGNTTSVQASPRLTGEAATD